MSVELDSDAGAESRKADAGFLLSRESPRAAPPCRGGCPSARNVPFGVCTSEDSGCRNKRSCTPGCRSHTVWREPAACRSLTLSMTPTYFRNYTTVHVSCQWHGDQGGGRLRPVFSGVPPRRVEGVEVLRGFLLLKIDFYSPKVTGNFHPFYPCPAGPLSFYSTRSTGLGRIPRRMACPWDVRAVTPSPSATGPPTRFRHLFGS